MELTLLVHSKIVNCSKDYKKRISMSRESLQDFTGFIVTEDKTLNH